MALNLGDLEISSPAFGHRGDIPGRHTVEGENVSPPLEWSGVPEGTRELALVCHDPDAPLPQGWTHWVVVGIPADSPGLPEAVSGGDHTDATNDFGDVGYGGPAPPPGHGPHHYYFWLYALDDEVAADPSLTRGELLDRIDGHVIEQARLIGVCER